MAVMDGADGIRAADRETAIQTVKNDNKKPCLNGKCFTGEILIYTSQGYRPIKEIQKGDDIYSKNAETGESGFREVEEVFQTGAHTIYHIWLDGTEEITTTAYHPIYVKEKGWVTAINLREGDYVETLDGSACITKIEKVRHEIPVLVYNFHVKEWGSYFVSKMKVYVHNGEGHEDNEADGENGCSGGVWREREEINKFRTDNGYTEREGTTVACVIVEGRSFIGTNSGISESSRDQTKALRDKWRKKIQWKLAKKKRPKHLGRAQSLTHAEAHALMEAYEKLEEGKSMPEEITLYVDRRTCNICRGELPMLLKAMGIRKLTIHCPKSDEDEAEWITVILPKEESK